MSQILFVGGTWTNVQDSDTKTYGKPSHLVSQFCQALQKHFDGTIDLYNGGNFAELPTLLDKTPNYDFVFWWTNVDNILPKCRNVKDIAPFTMLVNSKRDDDDKYDFQELIQRTLTAKANLTVKFKKIADKTFEITIFDPLGSVWYHGTDISKAAEICMQRLLFLKSMTRQQTESDTVNDKSLVMSWYFDQFKQSEFQSDKQIEIPDEQDFVNVVRQYAIKFQTFMPTTCKTERFIGNASLRPDILRPVLPPQVGRCGKGMPSFRGTGDLIFISKRNIDKQFIELNHFVPVYMDSNKLMYCGNDKPSVDTPVQIRLYQALPNINYMLHSHCYIENAPFTSTAIPCGAIEEFDEIINVIKNNTSTIIENVSYFAINLRGHGSIVMWNNMNQFHNEIEPTLMYYARKMPEIMY